MGGGNGGAGGITVVYFILNGIAITGVAADDDDALDWT